MESNYKENQQLSYRSLRSKRKQKDPVVKHIKDKNGVFLRRPAFMPMWVEYFKELLAYSGQEVAEAIHSLKLEKTAGIEDIC